MSYNFTTTPYDELTQADKKRVHKLQLKDNLSELQTILRTVLDTKAQSKALIKKYQNSRDQFSDDYIASLIQREKDTTNKTLLSLAEKGLKAIEKARQAVDDIHTIVDLGDIRMTNAIRIIQASGANLKPEVTRNLVNEFAGDQTALTMLQGVLSGASYDGGLTTMIYDPDHAFSQATEAIRSDMISPDGSINRVARYIAVIAKGEGCDFPEVFDSTEIDRMTRQAAGLLTE